MKKQNNAGFSLVELIVTILIMSILTAGVVVSVIAMHRADAEKEATKIANVLEKARMQVLSRSETTYVRLYADADGKYIALVQGGVATVTKLDDKATVSYKTDDGVETTLTGSAEVEIHFSKSSGAFQKNGYLVEYIKVTADKDLYVCLVADTGRCYIDTTY
ncbi:MAG: type II secretion system protein [Lachnospiraceae bacterium]|nr:type II secretion system protein [Lachnospiraceae bacterium]